MRFYKLPQNTGIHVGSLWAANGTLLGRVTFSDETDSGWQEARLPTSVPIVAHKAYVVSYHTDNGFGYDSGYFTTSRFRAPLYATANGVDGGNGLYGSAGSMPTNGGGNNYWADVVFGSNPLPTELEFQGPARSIWESSTYTPTLTAPMQQIEVGVRFQSARPGYIQGVRFFKGTSNSSEYLGNLWSEDGELLASGIFANETAVGWQEVTFARSVPFQQPIRLCELLQAAGYIALDQVVSRSRLTTTTIIGLMWRLPMMWLQTCRLLKCLPFG